MKSKGDKNSSLNYLPWYEKYRPSDLGEIIAHQNIVHVLGKLIEANRLPHILFYGSPGTGKTSTILACVKKMYAVKYSSMVLELNGSDDRGITTVREKIKEFAETDQSVRGRTKLVILDEADSMTFDAQFALRRIIEKYTFNTRFCIICNYVTKIIHAIQARCMPFRFAPLSQPDINMKLMEVVKVEKINITPSAIQAIMDICEGDMRKAYNILQTTHMTYDKVTANNVFASYSFPLPENINALVEWVQTKPLHEVYRRMQKLIQENGYSLSDIISAIVRKIDSLDVIPEDKLGNFIIQLADIQIRLSICTNDNLHLKALVSCFYLSFH